MAKNDLERKPVRYTLRLAKQLEEAINYLHNNYAPAQAEIMGRQFFKSVRLLEVMPGIGTIYKNGMRKIRLGKFRYNIFYRELEAEIEILGIWHTSRGTDFEA
ncbi:MAG: type II toxin-antitoxin system RelE/ParE family toxin [Fibromonadaceae bacterium]|jgi:plasmid stabilization system protein ParE|nr:type II toxin-antitoxin system RelE/ParE family toxin [Fibromonadaceae bacterium]